MEPFDKKTSGVPQHINPFIGQVKKRMHSSLLVVITAFAIASLGVVGCSDTPMLADEETDTDQEPPTVVSSTPSEGDVDVAVDQEITVTFSEEIDEETLTMSFYNPSTNASVRGTTEVSGSTLTFTPDEDFRNRSSYELLILEVDDLEGNTLEEAYSLVFQTVR